MKEFLFDLEVNKVYNWEDYFNFPLSESNLRDRIHERKEFFRISTQRYPSMSEQYLMKAGEIYHYVGPVSGMIKGYTFVLKGSVKYTDLSNKEKVVLHENSFWKNIGGNYEEEFNGECILIRLYFFEETPEIFEKLKKSYNL